MSRGEPSRAAAPPRPEASAAGASRDKGPEGKMNPNPVLHKKTLGGFLKAVAPLLSQAEIVGSDGLLRTLLV